MSPDPRPTPPVSKRCPVCDAHLTGRENECPRCRTDFPACVATPMQSAPPADDALFAEVEALCSQYIISGREPWSQQSWIDHWTGWIAASRELLPKLAAALREAREQIKRCSDQLASLQSDHQYKWQAADDLVGEQVRQIVGLTVQLAEAREHHQEVDDYFMEQHQAMGEMDAEIDALTEQLAERDQRIAKLEQRLADADAYMNWTLPDQMAEARAKIEALTQAVRDAEAARIKAERHATQAETLVNEIHNCPKSKWEKRLVEQERQRCLRIVRAPSWDSFNWPTCLVRITNQIESGAEVE